MIRWSEAQQSRVEAVLEAHPAESNRCAAAARGVLPIATEVDEGATALVIEPPIGAVYVLVRGRPVRWFHHVTVAAAEHCVDAYFHHADEHLVRPVEDDEWEVL